MADLGVPATALALDDTEIVHLASELAELRRVDARDAVVSALSDAIAHEREIARKRAQLDEIVNRVHAHLEHPLPSSDHKWLYDDDGLPV